MPKVAVKINGRVAYVPVENYDKLVKEYPDAIPVAEYEYHSDSGKKLIDVPYANRSKFEAEAKTSGMRITKKPDAFDQIRRDRPTWIGALFSDAPVVQVPEPETPQSKANDWKRPETYEDVINLIEGKTPYNPTYKDALQVLETKPKEMQKKIAK